VNDNTVYRDGLLASEVTYTSKRCCTLSTCDNAFHLRAAEKHAYRMDERVSSGWGLMMAEAEGEKWIVTGRVVCFLYHPRVYFHRLNDA